MESYRVARHIVPLDASFLVPEGARIVAVETWNQDAVAVYVLERLPAALAGVLEEE